MATDIILTDEQLADKVNLVMVENKNLNLTELANFCGVTPHRLYKLQGLNLIKLPKRSKRLTASLSRAKSGTFRGWTI